MYPMNLYLERPLGLGLLEELYVFAQNAVHAATRAVAQAFAQTITPSFAQTQYQEETNTINASSERAGIILDKYGDAILRVAYSYLHNMDDAEDILQDTLMQYLKTMPTFSGLGHERAWLLTVASNLSKNKIEYKKYRETDELMEELVAEEKTDLQYVWDAVKQLPTKYREVIHLYYQEGYVTKDIANILGRKESTVRSDLKRGREQLKKILKEAYDFE